MEFSLQEKIEAIRKEPDHIRRRYVVACVSISMILIAGIWFISVEDNITTVIGDIPEAAEQGKSAVGGAPSLNDLFERSTPLRVDEKNGDGETFFNQQMEGRDKETPVPSQ